MNNNIEISNKMVESLIQASSHIFDLINKKEVLSTWTKENGSLVTNLDIECEKLIVGILKNIFPIVTEEDPSTHQILNSESTYFTVDPIDGTTACKRYLYELGGHVGFGPLIGYVRDGQFVSSCFFHIPRRTIYLAIKNSGTFKYAYSSIDILEKRIPSFSEFQKLPKCLNVPLSSSAFLFYIGTNGEAQFIEKLKQSGLIENLYRFGGFANDSIRIAEGFEEGQIQFSIKAWDLAASLFTIETGSEAILDPLTNPVYFNDYKVKLNNPILVGRKEWINEVKNSLIL